MQSDNQKTGIKIKIMKYFSNSSFSPSISQLSTQRPRSGNFGVSSWLFGDGICGDNQNTGTK